MRLDIEEQIRSFVDSISYLWEDEPLNGDQTEAIAKRVLAELDDRSANR